MRLAPHPRAPSYRPGKLIYDKKEDILQHRWRFPSLSIHGVEVAARGAVRVLTVAGRILGLRLQDCAVPVRVSARTPRRSRGIAARSLASSRSAWCVPPASRPWSQQQVPDMTPEDIEKKVIDFMQKEFATFNSGWFAKCALRPRTHQSGQHAQGVQRARRQAVPQRREPSQLPGWPQCCQGCVWR